MRLYKEGDVVKIWSLQSFSYGGFINGKEGVVVQDQLKGSSVIVAVERRIDTEDEIDPNYEVYPEQIKLVSKSSGGSTITEFRLLIQKLSKPCSKKKEGK